MPHHDLPAALAPRRSISGLTKHIETTDQERDDHTLQHLYSSFVIGAPRIEECVIS